MRFTEIISEGDVLSFPKSANVGQQRSVNAKKGNITPIPKRTSNSNVTLHKDEKGNTVAVGKSMHNVYEESIGSRLKDLAKIATNMPDADFWLIRKGSDKTVGKPVTEFDPSRIGIKVVRTDVLDPKYLYYVMMHLHNQGHFARIANGTTNLVNIRVEDIANIPLGQQTESLNELAPSNGGEGDNNYLKTLARAWYNMDWEMLGDLVKQGKNPLEHRMQVQDAVENMLYRGIHCPDGKVRKYLIGYNAQFDGVEIQSKDHYEYGDNDDFGNDIDGRTGKPWGPYDAIEFAGNELDESVMESKERYIQMRITEFITESSKICPQCGMKGCTCAPGKCNCKPKPGYPKQVDEAANPAQQAAIAIAMKKAGKKPNNEGYAMEDEQVDGMAQGEIREIIKNAVKIKEKLDSGTSLDGWMYSYVTTSNDRLNSVAEQIGNPNISDEEDLDEGETWSKHNNKRVGGMSKKSVASYRRSHPGSKIQTAVTTKPSKLKKGSKAAKRRASFCARMRGMKKHRTSAKTANDPNSNINKSLRRWHCESVEQLQELVMLAEQKIRDLKK
jgi:choline kinase